MSFHLALSAILTGQTEDVTPFDLLADHWNLLDPGLYSATILVYVAVAVMYAASLIATWLRAMPVLRGRIAADSTTFAMCRLFPSHFPAPPGAASMAASSFGGDSGRW